MSSESRRFDEEVEHNIASLAADEDLQALTKAWINRAAERRYTYNFRWLGRPIIQLPQDIVAMQEIIYSVQPDLIIETGIAHGGSLILYASLLELNALCGGPADAAVIGIDIDLRLHNREAIVSHPLAKRIRTIDGSSIDRHVIAEVTAEAALRHRVMVCLDSNHTAEHVLAELEAYAPLTSVGSYCVVFDTVVERMPASAFADRPWSPGNSPMTAVHQFLASCREFRVDETIQNKLALTVAPDGYLLRVR